jgi:nucleotide-binding universal stress UspA family protein
MLAWSLTRERCMRIAQVEYSNVPTLVVRGSALPPPPEPTAPLDFGSSTGGRRVAICLDGTVTGRRMVAWAAQVLLRAADDIYLLHSPAGLEAADLLPAMAEVEACRGMLLARGFPEQRANPVELDFHVDARDAIVDFIEAGLQPFDLCICGSRGLQGRLTRLMLGSVGRYLLSYAPCPLLVLPAAVLKDPLAEAHEPGPA